MEKKPGFDAEAKTLMEDLKQDLHMEGLSSLRLINRYDIQGIDKNTYEMVVSSVFAEPALDDHWHEELPAGDDAKVFASEYLPGQYDQRADSAAQCIRIIKPEAEPIVKFARVYALYGDITEEELGKVIEYCINPVDSRQADDKKPLSLQMETTLPDDVSKVKGFVKMDETRLEEYRKQMGFAMSKADILHIHEYFSKEEKRDPSVTELLVIDTYWSDHCRHTTFNTGLSNIYFEESPYGELVRNAFQEYMEMRNSVYGDRKKDVCLMDMACIGAKYLRKQGKADDIDESEEVNACSIKVKATVDGKEEDWLVMFKNETHNHPTEIEPFGGAATCLGGAIRDPLSGRVYVYQAMRVTGAADPGTPVSETIKGKLPQRKITRQAAEGYSSYGNQIGLATGHVDEIYDEDYVAKRMEVGAVIGAAPADHVKREVPRPGDVVILVGGRTGRDGCGGATGSSKEHTEESIKTCGAEVQKGNPPIERNIQRLFRRKEAAVLIKRCNDFGAGGVSVAIGELAESLDIDLDLVPKKYEGLDGTELAISESQERMAVVVSAEDRQKFLAYAKEENLEATKVAKVTDTGRVRMFWRGKKILDILRAFLDTNGAKQTATVKVKAPVSDTERGETSIGSLLQKDLMEKPEDYLSDLNCCLKKGLIERFDSTIGASSVLMPLGGKYQLSPAPGMAAKLPMDENMGSTETATLMSFGYDPAISKQSPFHGAIYAVIDSVTKIVSMGGDFRNIRLSFQEYFEKLTSDESWGKPLASLLGALKVQKELEIPAIGGKDSMSGTFEDINVPPTLISFAVCTANAARVISPEFKKPESKIVYMAPATGSDGMPDIAVLKQSLDKVHELSDSGKILSAFPAGRGGIFMAVAKMALGNRIGAKLFSMSRRELLSSGYGGLVLEISKKEDIGKLFGDTHYKVVGETREQTSIIYSIDGSENKISLNEVLRRSGMPLEDVFPVRTADFKEKCEEGTETLSYEMPGEMTGKMPGDVTAETTGKMPGDVTAEMTGKRKGGPLLKVPEPRVIIPTFPGTNCEVDSARAFIKAGADARICIIRNLDEDDLRSSIKELAENIKEAQMIMIPGGFSGGDEPDGSAKFITAVFKNPKVAEALTELLENRDGLMLGICNGFQALIKLGLLPFGKICEADSKSPTLTYNKIGRHMSCMVRTRVASVKSPWLSGCRVGDVFTLPVSHGEGRFVCEGTKESGLLGRLVKNGQIATQYVDFEGKAAMDIRYNPNHSVLAVEGLTSPDGRIFGKMGHSERIGENVYKNIPGKKDQKIFESGVAYFK